MCIKLYYIRRSWLKVEGVSFFLEFCCCVYDAFVFSSVVAEVDAVFDA